MDDPGSLAFVVIGEALIDLAPPADDGASIARPGGSPMNVAIGLARLGQPAAFAGRLSETRSAPCCAGIWSARGYDLRHAVTAARGTEHDRAGGAVGRPGELQFSLRGADFQWSAAELAFLPGGAHAVHFGSLASWLPPGDAAIAAAVSRLRRGRLVLISYDPNIRPSLLPDAAAAARRQIEESVSLAHVVKASQEDLPGCTARQ